MESRPQFADKFLVGIAQIDREHRQLFDIAGRVYDGLGATDEKAVEMTRAAVIELLEYTATHFASEEALMAAAGYPELEPHRLLHKRLLAQARDMEMRVELDDSYVPVELSQFITRWLVEHIEATDRRFGEFVAAQNPR